MKEPAGRDSFTGDMLTVLEVESLWSRHIPDFVTDGNNGAQAHKYSCKPQNTRQGLGRQFAGEFWFDFSISRIGAEGLRLPPYLELSFLPLYTSGDIRIFRTRTSETLFARP